MIFFNNTGILNSHKSDESNPSPPRRVRCLNPFRWLEVNNDGQVTPCCNTWFKGHLGSIRDQSLEEIWNGAPFRALRKAMYEGGEWEKFCNKDTCPQIINDTWVFIDHISPETHDFVPITQPLLDHIRAGKTEMSIGPVQIGLSCDPRCNLRCIMCFATHNPNRDGTLIRKALHGMESFLPGVKRIKMLGDGEVFAIPETRDFLLSFDSKSYPETSFLIHTNGILLTPGMWKKLSHLKIDTLVISIDAATKETYEKIRVGGKWEVLMKNIEFLLARFRKGMIREFLISMTVMKTNHREMIAFAEMGKRLGVTLAFFSPIYGDWAREQIFDRRDIPCLKRISEQLRHPIMKESFIDTSAMSMWRDFTPSLADYKIIARCALRGIKNRLSF